ncbi:MAG: 16S rRNA (cytosine(1402)-N(4))-methyltransferase RsmH [Acidobacteria bacterium]|nr:16S rRNA (cytosine(1402)-N(4))-methyltransferase RsmH [Acidobacteriota bacterium]
MGGDGKDTPEGGGRGQVAHVPVLLKEATDFLAIRRGGIYIDATVGLGGHSIEIARRLGAAGLLIGFDKDPAALEIARDRLRPQQDAPEWPEVRLAQASFAEAGERCPTGSADGILADLGLSSLQLADPDRGFSFQAEGLLDMRMNPQSEPTAEQVVNQFEERELADLIYELGEERRSRRIARAIVRSRPIRSPAHLAAIISAAARPMKRERIHPATRTFQALRIFVNRELDDLGRLLQAAPELLRSGGRLVVISFHSLEDRVVKDAMRAAAKRGDYRLLTAKPVVPGRDEIGLNPRARSAKLRAAERV